MRTLLLGLAAAAPAAAQISVPAGFTTLECAAGGQPTGIVLTPPGSAWGERLYFTTFLGQLRVVDPLATGTALVLGGLPGGSSAASSIIFDDGFGTGDLLLSMEGSMVVRVDQALNATVWASGTGILAPNDLCFPPAGGSFGTRLFVSNGNLVWSDIGRIDPTGAPTLWAPTPSSSTAAGLAFPTAGNGFPDRLFVADTNNDQILAYAPDATGVSFASITDPLDIAFGPGGAFGTDLYISTLAGNIERMDAAGNVTTFATGLSLDPSGWNGDLVFQPNGEALWVAANNLIVRFGAGPGIPFCQGNGALAACPCGNDGASDDRGGCLNSTGAGGLLAGTGSASVAADDLGFVASQVPVNQFCILFAGDQSVAEVPIGDGLRCVGGSLVRLGLRPTGAAGVATWSGGLGASGGWLAGDSRSFQVWYRDPLGSPCGTNFNVTHALSVTLLP